MDIGDSPEEASFRDRARSYIESVRAKLVPSGTTPTPEHVADFKRTQAILHQGGLVGITWPTEYGGGSGSPIQQIIIDQELERARVPRLINWIGVGMCGPTILAHGTEAQKHRYLSAILSADEVWCQLFSEPAAGSDLAGIKARAVRQENSWRVTGQKVWTTGAQWCDYGMLLTRTDPDAAPHAGLTMFIVDMKTAGVTVRPLREMTGEAMFNEIFFDEVEISDDARVGEIGGGWQVALTMLMNERFTVAGDGSTYGAGPEALTEALRENLPLLPPEQHTSLRTEFASCWIEALACRMTGARLITSISRGEMPGPEGSVGKLSASLLLKRAADLGVRLQGDDALFGSNTDGNERWQRAAAFAPGVSLAGGSTEVMKNILGERVLGLPREPKQSPSSKKVS